MQQAEFGFLAPPPPTVVLHLASSLDHAWQGAMRAWFTGAASDAWRSEESPAVLVPHRAHAHWLKSQLLKSGISHLGVRFLTPAALRESLAHHFQERPLPAADLQLLLSWSALQHLAGGDGSDTAAAKAVVRTPRHLLRTLERLQLAGWNLDALPVPVLRAIAATFHEKLARSGLRLTGETDRAVLAACASAEPLFSDLLVAGFDAAHWSHWFLLQSGISLSRRATVVLNSPRHEAFALDELWIGSWEERFTGAVPLPAMGEGRTETKPELLFLAGLDATEQAGAMTELVLEYLGRPDSHRIGIVFPRAGVLPRLTASRLSALGIPHNDSIGFASPGQFESFDWEAWLQFQHAPRLLSLLSFLHTLPAASALFSQVTPARVERLLRRAYADTLLDDLRVFRAWLSNSTAPHSRDVANLLDQVEVLPAAATWSEFVPRLEEGLAKLGWEDRGKVLRQNARDLSEMVPGSLPRTLFLRWLDETATSATAARASAGDHPYARVHLMTIAQAEGQPFSELIVAGLNEGEWPPAEVTDFPGESEIETHNARVKRRNRRLSRQGKEGEGHAAVTPGHALYLGPSERRALATRQFAHLLDCGAKTIAFTASLANEAEPERLRNPGEALTRLFYQERGEALTHAVLKELRENTKRWMSERDDTRARREKDAREIRQTRHAYLERRDRTKAAGPFDYTLRQSPATAEAFSVSNFEEMLSHPALIWLARFLGVKAADDPTGAWVSSTGQWAHHWLASIAPAGDSFVPRPAPPEIDARICEAAERKRAEITALCRAAGVPLPDWWKSGWHNARALARHLGARLASVTDWTWIASEWKVEGTIALGDKLQLRLRGQIDLILAPEKLPEASLRCEPLWIIDFKTGQRGTLAVTTTDPEKMKTTLRKRLLEGDAIQLALYALAAEAAGAKQVKFSLVSPAVRPVEPQLDLDQFADHREVFAELARMQETGRFGMLGQVRSLFGFAAPYPIATLAIDPSLLEEKWELTHPVLAREEEERW